MSQNNNVVVIAESVAKPGSEDALRELLKSLVAPTLIEEGCIRYELHEQDGEPGKFLFVEAWASKEALQKHSQSEHLKAFGPKARELAAGGGLRLFRQIA